MHGLEIEDPLAKLLAFESIAQGLVHGRLCSAHGHSGGPQPPRSVEPSHDGTKSIFTAKTRVLRDATIVKGDRRRAKSSNPKQVQLAANRQTGRILLDNESPHAL